MCLKLITNLFEDIYEKDLISIIHLLVAIVKHYKVALNLPENLTVKVIIIQVEEIFTGISMALKLLITFF